MKPDVLKQIDEITKSREKQMEEHANKVNMQQNNILQNMGISPEDIERLRKNPQEVQKLIHENQQRINHNQIFLQMISNNTNNGQITCNINGKEEILDNSQIVNILTQQDTAINSLREEI